MANWVIRNARADIAKMTEDFNISPIFATVLANRNVLTARGLATYLYNEDEFFYSPFDMLDMENGIKKVIKCIEEKKLICIYGDYDVDGVTSTVILYKGLKKLGANIMHYIPDREEEGYGLNNEASSELKIRGVDLILTCDNGISSIEEAEYIKENDMQLVIIDHHEPRFTEQEGERGEILPIADAIINPKRRDCKYPFKALSAGGVSLKFIKGIYDYKQIQIDMSEFMVFASISTVCDIVDLLDENRMITKRGLHILNENKKINMGLYELLKINEIHDKIIDEYHYGFILGPCINASGRLESALKAVELFIEEDEKKAVKLASELLGLNAERKVLTLKAVEQTMNAIEKTDIANDKVLVIYNEEIHESIAGIVAGRVKEAFYKPTFVITKSKNAAKGSGRGIPAYSMFEELLKCEHLLDRFGGHKMAAGLSLSIENIDSFRKTINKNTTLTEKDLTEEIVIDKAIAFSNIELDLAEELEGMKPIGKENRGAIFATKNVFIKNIRFVGKEKNILQLLLEDDSGNSFNSISFSLYQKFVDVLKENIPQEEYEKILAGIKKNVDLKIDVVYSIDINIFNNFKNIQLRLRDFRVS